MTKSKLSPRTTATAAPTKDLSQAEGRKFRKAVDVPDPTPKQAAARKAARVVQNHNSRTAIELRRAAGQVTYIHHDGDTYEVRRMSAEKFDQEYHRELTDYPPGRAAKLYVGFMAVHGGSAEAIEELENLVTLTKKEKEMAAAKFGAKPKAEREDSDEKPKKKVASDKEKPAASKAKKADSKPRASAASLFKELILAGKKTDDEIFAEVKKAFGISDTKRQYVTWYRNKLKKEGHNPPPAK